MRSEMRVTCGGFATTSMLVMVSAVCKRWTKNHGGDLMPFAVPVLGPEIS